VKETYRFLLFFTSFCAVLCLLLDYLKITILSEYDLFFSVLSISSFLYVSSTIIYLTMSYIEKKFPKKSGYVFMGFAILKMIATIVFLIPLLGRNAENKIAPAIYFFIPFFIVLFVETYFVVRLIGKKS